MIAISKNALFLKIASVLGKWHSLPDTGTGAPGLLLEQLLGIQGNALDLPDAGGWEIKYHGGKSLLTMFHKTPKPAGIIKSFIDTHGWYGSDGKKCFRFTLSGTDEQRGFRVKSALGELIVSHYDGLSAHWSHDDIMTAAASKLRRLVLVTGEKKKGRVIFHEAFAYTDFRLTQFIPATVQGIIKIDFDARYKNGTRDKKALRDHGTKFRIGISDLATIYGTANNIS